eukprot:3291421-Prorocentrum_lima.AAC.1
MSSPDHHGRYFCGSAAQLEDVVEDPFLVGVEAGMHALANVFILNGIDVAVRVASDAGRAF